MLLLLNWKHLFGIAKKCCSVFLTDVLPTKVNENKWHTVTEGAEIIIWQLTAAMWSLSITTYATSRLYSYVQKEGLVLNMAQTILVIEIVGNGCK